MQTKNYVRKIIAQNPKRIASLLLPGDEVTAFINHNFGSFKATAEVRAVAHWGVYAVFRDKSRLEKMFNSEIGANILKRQFLIKWRNIIEFHLK